jgi:SH3 domain-containing YSC84-like protein 1
MSVCHCFRLVRSYALIAVLTLALVGAGIVPAAADGGAKPQKLVDAAAKTLENFFVDPNMGWFRGQVIHAKGLLIVPELVKAGLVFGGSGGRGVLLVRDETTGQWSQPAFYTLGSVSWGLQLGVKKSEVVMLVMSPRGLESLYSSSFKLGGEASVAAGPVGAGAEGATAPNLSADYLSFARSQGVFAGLSLEGAVIKTTDKYNQTYYGRPVRPIDIIVTQQVNNPGSTFLRQRAALIADRK